MAQAVSDITVARGILEEATDDGVVLALPGTDYRLRLVLRAPLPASAEVGKPIEGRVWVEPSRVDSARAGGRFIEPVYGRPRRLQGRVLAIDPEANALVVHCGCPVIVPLNRPQRATDFEPAGMVSFGVEPGAAFEPSAG